MKKIVLKTSCILLSASSLFASDTPTEFLTDTEGFQRAHTFRGLGEEFEGSQFVANMSPNDISKQEEIDQRKLKTKHNEETLEKRKKLIEKLKTILQKKQELSSQENIDSLETKVEEVKKALQKTIEHKKKWQDFIPPSRQKQIDLTESQIKKVEAHMLNVTKNIEKLIYLENPALTKTGLREAKKTFQEMKEYKENLQKELKTLREEKNDIIKEVITTDEINIQKQKKIARNLELELDKIMQNREYVAQIKSIIEEEEKKELREKAARQEEIKLLEEQIRQIEDERENKKKTDGPTTIRDGLNAVELFKKDQNPSNLEKFFQAFTGREKQEIKALSGQLNNAQISNNKEEPNNNKIKFLNEIGNVQQK